MRWDQAGVTQHLGLAGQVKDLLAELQVGHLHQLGQIGIVGPAGQSKGQVGRVEMAGQLHGGHGDVGHVVGCVTSGAKSGKAHLVVMKSARQICAEQFAERIVHTRHLPVRPARARYSSKLAVP